MVGEAGHTLPRLPTILLAMAGLPCLAMASVGWHLHVMADPAMADHAPRQVIIASP